jgi:hypothetical protein
VATEKICPVCGQAFGDSPARCFRCETDLGSWWRFEDEMRGLASAARSRPPRGALALAACLAVLSLSLAVALSNRARVATEAVHPAPPRPVVAVEGPTPPSPAESRPPSVRYTVQSGDSAWRIAAALTGQGRRWRELWPDSPPRLVPGMVLDVPVRVNSR